MPSVEVSPRREPVESPRPVVKELLVADVAPARGVIPEPAHVPLEVPAGESMADMVARSGVAEARAHEAFLRFSQQATEAMGGTIAFQSRLIELLGGNADVPLVEPVALVAEPVAGSCLLTRNVYGVRDWFGGAGVGAGIRRG